MTIEAVVFFCGPETQWSGKVSEREVIARRSYRWLWLARMFAKNAHSNLLADRCGYLLLKDGAELEHVGPVALKL